MIIEKLCRREDVDLNYIDQYKEQYKQSEKMYEDYLIWLFVEYMKSKVKQAISIWNENYVLCAMTYDDCDAYTLDEAPTLVESKADRQQSILKTKARYMSNESSFHLGSASDLQNYFERFVERKPARFSNVMKKKREDVDYDYIEAQLVPALKALGAKNVFTYIGLKSVPIKVYQSKQGLFSRHYVESTVNKKIYKWMVEISW